MAKVLLNQPEQLLPIARHCPVETLDDEHPLRAECRDLRVRFAVGSPYSLNSRRHSHSLSTDVEKSARRPPTSPMGSLKMWVVGVEPRGCVFHANWTPVPPQTGQSFQRKVDTRSRPNWTPVPGKTGHLGRNGAGLRCGFTPDGANLSNLSVFSVANRLSN